MERLGGVEETIRDMCAAFAMNRVLHGCSVHRFSVDHKPKVYGVFSHYYLHFTDKEKETFDNYFTETFSRFSLFI